jgi:hypothetical protein
MRDHRSGVYPLHYQAFETELFHRVLTAPIIVVPYSKLRDFPDPTTLLVFCDSLTPILQNVLLSAILPTTHRRMYITFNHTRCQTCTVIVACALSLFREVAVTSSLACASSAAKREDPWEEGSEKNARHGEACADEGNVSFKDSPHCCLAFVCE